jgi:hypothetical protein
MPRTTADIERDQADGSLRSQVITIVRCAIALLAPACFHPSYDHPACGPNGECPSGLTCSLQRICEAPGFPGSIPDGSIDTVSPISDGPVDAASRSNCGDIKSHVSGAVDGTYTLYLGGDSAKPWQAYCAGIANTPHEYLSLTGTNFAQYTQGGKSSGTDVRTTFTKVRFDPSSLRVDISDRSFATSTGMLNHAGSGTMVMSMPYSVAMDCASNNSKTGVAQIDLTGTSFVLPNGFQFFEGGNNPSGAVQMPDNQHATINGGGNCGWIGPMNTPVNAFNNNVTSGNGTILQLAYAP